ncbi:DUF2793 domain-containing protein [Novosphingobium sp. MW5]|nr:DUF2793 domain-containing protein [Novosphingobium sp. MW5]
MGYVSGFLRTLPPPGEPRLEGADAMHAWVRAWAGPVTGWIEFDPTNDQPAGVDYITVARGRDYRDVSPVMGVMRTTGGQDSRHSVDVVPADESRHQACCTRPCCAGLCCVGPDTPRFLAGLTLWSAFDQEADMDETSTNLSLPYLQAAQAQKHLTHNAALEKLDLIVQLSVQSYSQNTPPLTPQEGQVWAVGPAPVNDWAGQAGALAAYANGGWLFLAPQTGWRATLETEIRVWDGAAWVAPDLPDLQNVPGVGVNTSYDSTNKLAVAAAATLMTHDGAGHQLKVNKAASGDTASLVFQTGFSGRAEMGTLGDDSFGVKVSPDGTALDNRAQRRCRHQCHDSGPAAAGHRAVPGTRRHRCRQ